MNKKQLLSLFTALIILIIILLIIIFSFQLVKNYQAYQTLNIQRTKLQGQIKTWQSITEKFKGYKDGYLQLAVLEYQLGDYNKAKEYLDKALYLDPGFKEAGELLKKLNY